MSSGTDALKKFLTASSALCTALLAELDASSKEDFVAKLPATVAAALDPSIATLSVEQLKALKECLATLVPAASDELAKAETIAEHVLAVVSQYVAPAPAPTPAPEPTPTPEPAPQPEPTPAPTPAPQA